MRQREEIRTVEPRYLGIKDLCSYTGLGMNSAAELGKAAGARLRFGKRVMFDKQKVDNYLTAQIGEA